MVRFLLRVLVAAIVLLALAIVGYRMLAFQREVRAAEALMVDGSRMVDTPLGQVQHTDDADLFHHALARAIRIVEGPS